MGLSVKTYGFITSGAEIYAIVYHCFFSPYRFNPSFMYNAATSRKTFFVGKTVARCVGLVRLDLKMKGPEPLPPQLCLPDYLSYMHFSTSKLLQKIICIYQKLMKLAFFRNKDAKHWRLQRSPMCSVSRR